MQMPLSALISMISQAGASSLHPRGGPGTRRRRTTAWEHPGDLFASPRWHAPPADQRGRFDIKQMCEKAPEG
jgi:hypothetical protein